MQESPYLSCVWQTTFTHNSILTMIHSGYLGWVWRCVRLCACVCAREANGSACAYVCGRKDKQSSQSGHFCLMKNGRLAFRDVVMCRILMCAHQTASPNLKVSGTEVKPSIDQPHGRSNSWGNISSRNYKWGARNSAEQVSLWQKEKLVPGIWCLGVFEKTASLSRLFNKCFIPRMKGDIMGCPGGFGNQIQCLSSTIWGTL